MLLSLIEIKRRDLIEVEISSDATILDLKLAISAEHGFSLSGMRIVMIRDGLPTFCPDSSALSSLRITDSDVLKLYAKGISMPPPDALLVPYNAIPLGRRPNTHMNEIRVLTHFFAPWNLQVWRDMAAWSRYPLTVEDSQVLHILSFGNPALYCSALQAGVPFWTYGDRMGNVITVLQRLALPGFMPHFMVELGYIFQELMLAAVESKDRFDKEGRKRQDAVDGDEAGGGWL